VTKSSVLKKDGLTHVIEVTVPAMDIAKTVKRELENYGKKVKIDGFRPGKVPLPILKQKYGNMILGEVLEKTVQESNAKVLKEQDIRPALQPKVELKDDQKFDENSDLTYTMTVEALPKFDVMDLSTISIEKPIAKVEDKVINETLERIAKSNRSFTKVEEDRKTKMGDIAIIDFDGKTKEGKSVEGMSGKAMSVELGSGSLIPGFEDQLVGKKAGNDVTVDVKFPEDYHQKELAGEPAIFECKIVEIREASETNIDDELAKKLRFESLDTLKDAIVKEISGDYEQLTRMKVKRALLDALDEKHSFELPSGMVDLEFESITKQMEKEKSQKGETLSEEEKENLKVIAERRVRLGLVLAEVGRSNNVDVSNDELTKAIHAEARKYPGQEMQVLEFYSKNPQVIESFRAPIFEDKVVDFILAKATVTETSVSIDDLTKDDDDTVAAKPKKSAKKK
jgi:trigger factor